MSTNPRRAVYGLILAISIFSNPCCGDEAKAADQLLPPSSTEEQKMAHGDANSHLVDGLNQGHLQEAFRLLRSEYIKKEELDYLSLNRAALQGVLDRLGNGAVLLTEASRSSRNSPFSYHSCRFGDQVGYIRFGKFNREEVTSLDTSLEDFRKHEKMKTLILDLRSPGDQADFQVASQILSRFRPPNELLFKIRRPGNDRPDLFISESGEVFWSGETVVLIDGETGSAGEMIALVLQQKSGSLIIGEASRGTNVEFRDVPIGPDRILRYATAEVVLEDGLSIYQKGLQPDLEAISDPQGKKAIFKAVDQGDPLEKFLFRMERPRLNEAALVAGTNPELDYFLARKNGQSSQWDGTLPSDRALRMAVDILLSRDFLDLGKRRKKLR